jgi:hypothetical protein
MLSMRVATTIFQFALLGVIIVMILIIIEERNKIKKINSRFNSINLTHY